MSTDRVGSAPRQERSRRTQATILAAGTELLEEGGFEALAVSAVAERAGVSVGGVYRRFGTKDQLLLALQEQFTTGFLADFQARLAGAEDETDGPELVRIAMSGMAETFRARTRLLRVFILISTQHDAVSAVGSKAARAAGMSFRAVLRHAECAIVRSDSEAAIDFVYRLAYAACEHRVIHAGEHFESDLPLSWPVLTDELTLTAQLYLFGGPRG
jgi:AcrR family transcriptional regulator